jgi:predicted RNase H-like nuclease
VDCFVGIDGCRDGWVAVALCDEQPWELRVFSGIEKLWQSLPHVKLLLIDIPIGLRDEGPEERLCDVEARKLLGQGRASSVFRAPARAVLDYESREEASEVNYSLTGRRIGAQTWGIVPKIQEVDRFLRRTCAARSKFREIHPEVLFWALNGRRAMSCNKKRLEGFVERLNVLRRHFRQCDELVIEALTKFPRNQVAGHDILDALAAAVTGVVGSGRLVTIPEEPERDAHGLPMEMVYYDQDWLNSEGGGRP